MEHQVQQELASGSPEVPNYPGYVMFTFIRITIFFLTIKPRKTMSYIYKYDLNAMNPQCVYTLHTTHSDTVCWKEIMPIILRNRVVNS